MPAKTIVSWILIAVLCLVVSALFTAAHAKVVKWVFDDVKWDVYDYTTPDVPPVRDPVQFSCERLVLVRRPDGRDK